MIRPLALAMVWAASGALCATVQAPKGISRYLSPTELAVSPDGRRLYVVCEQSDELLVIDTRSGRKVKAVAVGHVPRGLSISVDGSRAYVANSWSDTVSVIDTAKLTITQTLHTGYEPISVIADKSNETLYTANRLSNDVSVIDLHTGVEVKRLAAGRGASYLSLSPDGSRIFCTHIYPAINPNRAPPQSEITVISTANRKAVDRVLLNNVAGVFHSALSTDGKLLTAALVRPKNLIPLAHVEHGGVFTNAVAVLGADLPQPVVVPIDELDRYFAIPFGIALTSDNSRLFVSSSGSNTVTAINLPALRRVSAAKGKSIANDLSVSAKFVIARIPVGQNPRGIVLSPDGKRLYVANRMDDTVSLVDTAGARIITTFRLNDSNSTTPLRRGEQLFNDARFSFQGQFSCASCHIDATFDGLQWDLEPDGFGADIVDNRSIERLIGTQPYKWNGGNPDLPTECGPRTEKFFYRSQSFDSKQLTDLVTYVLSVPARPNRFRPMSGALSSAQERGKAIFERSKYKNGKIIPETKRCGYCHSGPNFTSNQPFDVGTGRATDRSSLVDTPQLFDVAYSAPYLHDGAAKSLEEIWTIFNPKDQHGATNDLTKDELNDLIEYLRTL
jgi:YVTN family beta-propeller protein